MRLPFKFLGDFGAVGAQGQRPNVSEGSKRKHQFFADFPH